MRVRFHACRTRRCVICSMRSRTLRRASPPVENTGKLWNAFEAIKAVRYGPEWRTNIREPKNHSTTSQRADSQRCHGSFPTILTPITRRSTIPVRRGSRASSMRSARARIGTRLPSSSSGTTGAASTITCKPPFFDHWGGLGFRVPLIVISPYARETHPGTPGYISHTRYEFGSILKFIENARGLGSLGTSRRRANSIVDCFDFTRAPRPFTKIKAPYSREYFLHQPYSHQPVDSE